MAAARQRSAALLPRTALGVVSAARAAAAGAGGLGGAEGGGVVAAVEEGHLQAADACHAAAAKVLHLPIGGCGSEGEATPQDVSSVGQSSLHCGRRYGRDP